MSYMRHVFFCKSSIYTYYIYITYLYIVYIACCHYFHSCSMITVNMDSIYIYIRIIYNIYMYICNKPSQPRDGWFSVVWPSRYLAFGQVVTACVPSFTVGGWSEGRGGIRYLHVGELRSPKALNSWYSWTTISPKDAKKANRCEYWIIYILLIHVEHASVNITNFPVAILREFSMWPHGAVVSKNPGGWCMAMVWWWCS